MSIRKRRWTTRRGVEKEAWIVEHIDQQGKRHIRTFKHKRFADAFAAGIVGKVRHDTQTADGDSISLADAAEQWMLAADAIGLGQSSRGRYRQHVRLHIIPFLGMTRLAQLTVPMVRDFKAKLRAHGRSDVIVRDVIGSLESILADAQERGQVCRNAVRDMRSRRPRKETRAGRRGKGKLTVGLHDRE